MTLNRGGRPPVGPAVQVRLAPDLLARVEALTALAGITRPEMIRRLIAAGLDAVTTPKPPSRLSGTLQHSTKPQPKESSMTTMETSQNSFTFLTGNVNGSWSLCDYVGDAVEQFDIEAADAEHLAEVKAILAKHCPGWTLAGNFIYAEVDMQGQEIERSDLEAARQEIDEIDFEAILGRHEKK